MISHSKPWILPEDFESISKQLVSSSIALGNQTEWLCEEFSSMADSKYTLLCSSGSAALLLSLKSLDLKKGDEVIIPSYTCDLVYKAVIAAGGVPRVCDVGHLWNMTVDSVQVCITKNTRCLILVNIFGLVQNVSDYRKFNVPIINDLCQCFDAVIDSKLIDLGDIICLSFQATKCLTSAEGGAILVRNNKYIDSLKNIWLQYSCFFKFSDLQAALLGSQLRRYTKFQEKRHEVAEIFFKNIPTEWISSLYKIKDKWYKYRFPLYIEDLDFSFFANFMLKKGIHVRRGVDQLLHRFDYSDALYPNSVAIFNKTLSIPFYPALLPHEISLIIESCNELYTKF